MPRTGRNDLDKYNYIVQSNDLIMNANWRLNIISLKIYLMMISCIDTNQPLDDHIEVNMKKSEIIRFLQAAGETEVDYVKAKAAMMKLRETTIALDEGKGIRYVGFTNDLYWEKDSEIVNCQIHRKLVPFLLELKENFSKIPLLNIQFFRSKYGLILYQYLMAEWKKTKKKRITIDITKLRHITDTKDKYPRFESFERRVIKAAVEDINQAEVDFTVSYEKRRMGKTIEFIDFYICPQEM